jgi:hypothetical protein
MNNLHSSGYVPKARGGNGKDDATEQMIHTCSSSATTLCKESTKGQPRHRREAPNKSYLILSTTTTRYFCRTTKMKGGARSVAPAIILSPVRPKNRECHPTFGDAHPCHSNLRNEIKSSSIEMVEDKNGIAWGGTKKWGQRYLIFRTVRATILNRYGCKEGRSHRLRAGSSAGGGKSGGVGVHQQFNQR